MPVSTVKFINKLLKLILARFFPVLLILLLKACIGTGSQQETSSAKSDSANHSSTPNGQLETNGKISESTQTPCLNTRRPLNPDSTPQPSETDLDRYFRLAYNAETAGDFDTAITYYQKAAELASCECDRAHAQAGKQAAQEAQALLATEGAASKPTQYFWGRLQELTRSLPCVTEQ